MTKQRLPRKLKKRAIKAFGKMLTHIAAEVRKQKELAPLYAATHAMLEAQEIADGAQRDEVKP